MLKTPYHRLRTANAGGFTLVELLVVIGIIAILAGVALGPITGGIKKAKESGAMQTTRTIALAEFQYANDNDQSYPDGTDAGVVGLALITGNYVSDPGLFFISGDTTGAIKLAGVATSFKAVNCSYDFTGVGANVGVPSTAPDQLPLVWSTGQTGLAYPAANVGQAFAPAGGVFGKDGIAICYKSNNAFFRAPNGNASILFPPQGQAIFIDQTFDPSGVTYLIRAGASGK